MHIQLATILRAKLCLRIIALVSAFLMWFIIRDLHSVRVTYVVPVVWYNALQGTTPHEYPEFFTVTLHGKRAALKTVDESMLAIHLDASRYDKPYTPLQITGDDLFLPSSIKLISYMPSNGYIKKIS